MTSKDGKGMCTGDIKTDGCDVKDDKNSATSSPRQKQQTRLPRPRSAGSASRNCPRAQPRGNMDGDNNAEPQDEPPSEVAEMSNDVKNANNPQFKDNIASKKRFDLKHGGCDNAAHLAQDYVTPLQKREQLVKELKAQVKDLQRTLDEREAWWQEQMQQKEKVTKEQMTESNERIAKLTMDMERLGSHMQEGAAGIDETKDTISTLEETIQKLQDDIERKEKQHQHLYLEMYLKGKSAATFERMEEIERLATHNPQSVTIRELLGKLMDTEHELEKWQSIRRDESYHSFSKPETEPEVILSFLKDAMFHYLTDDKDQEEHLRAIVEIFEYTSEEKAKIHAALMARRKKGKNKIH